MHNVKGIFKAPLNSLNSGKKILEGTVSLPWDFPTLKWQKQVYRASFSQKSLR